MEIVIFSVILLILLLIFDTSRCSENKEVPLSPFIIVVSIIGTTIFILNSTINPIEVYRGNTTLEITYRDSVPIDSVVILKK